MVERWLRLSNFTSIDLVVDLLETQLFGSTAILGLFIISFFVIILLIARSFTEVAVMIPFPLLISLSQSGFIPSWIEPLAYIVAGFYLATIILIIAGLRSK